jgi:hypothetical protein
MKEDASDRGLDAGCLDEHHHKKMLGANYGSSNPGRGLEKIDLCITRRLYNSH